MIIHTHISYAEVKLLYAKGKSITPHVTCSISGRIMQKASKSILWQHPGQHPGHRKLLLCSFQRLSNVDVKRSKMPHLAKTALITKLPSTWKPRFFLCLSRIAPLVIWLKATVFATLSRPVIQDLTECHELMSKEKKSNTPRL